MGLEAVTNIADLVRTNPTSADAKSQGDDHLRNIKTALLNNLVGFPGAIMVTGTDGGAVNAYTLTPAYGTLVAYGNRMVAVFSPTITNTGAVTLNIAALGAKDVKSVDGVALVANDLLAGSVYAAFYNGSEFRLLSITKNYADQLAFGSALPAQPGGPSRYDLASIAGVAQWILNVPNQILRSVRTSNSILVQADRQTLVDITSGTFTQTFSPAASLGNGWFFYMRNSGTGDVTLDPDSAETIDGLASFIMYPGEARLILCDGTKFISVVLQGYQKRFTASGTWVKPPGYSRHSGIAHNGGSSGEKSSGGIQARGGGGGGAYPFTLADSFLGATETVTIGAGGAAVSAVSTAGNIGGVTSFGTWIVGVSNTTAGVGFQDGNGFYGGYTATPGARAVGFEGYLSTTTVAENTWGGSAANSNGSLNSGNTVWGGAAGGSVSSGGVARNGGTSKFGGNGGNGVAAGNGIAGTAPAGGGGATQTGAQSGAGAAGQLEIWGEP